jgi:hypothetical protein
MNRNGLNFIKLFPIMAAAAVLVLASAANPQAAERRAPEASIQVGKVTERSPAVDLKAIGREVAPGVIEVDPSSIRGKRLILPPVGGAARHLCIGKWDGAAKTCKGVYVEW